MCWKFAVKHKEKSRRTVNLSWNSYIKQSPIKHKKYKNHKTPSTYWSQYLFEQIKLYPFALAVHFGKEEETQNHNRRANIVSEYVANSTLSLYKYKTHPACDAYREVIFLINWGSKCGSLKGLTRECTDTTNRTW